MLRYHLWTVAGETPGEVVVDPLFVAAVTETQRRGDHGVYRQVAVIRLADGTEYTVLDDARTAAADVWFGKSINTGPFVG